MTMMTKKCAGKTEEEAKDLATHVLATELNDPMRMARIESIIEKGIGEWVATIVFDSLD